MMWYVCWPFLTRFCAISACDGRERRTMRPLFWSARYALRSDAHSTWPALVMYAGWFASHQPGWRQTQVVRSFELTFDVSTPLRLIDDEDDVQ